MKITEPIQNTIIAKAHTPQYRMHKYFARRPYNVFSNLINHYSNPGDVVLDCFCGGGVTIFEAVAQNRKAIGVDVNPLATFITKMQMFDGDIDDLTKTYNDFIQSIKAKYEDWYCIELADDSGICEWVEWVYVVSCPLCHAEIELVERNKVRNGIYQCLSKECQGIQGVRRVDCIPKRTVPVRARYKSNKTNTIIEIELEKGNYNIVCGVDYKKMISDAPHKPNFTLPLNWDRQFEDKLKEKGVTEYRHFFTERNYALNVKIFNDIISLQDTLSPTMYEYIYFLFSSSLRYTNNMTRVTSNWEGGNPTAMDKHAFWLPNQFIETNVIDIIEKRCKAIIKGCTYSKKSLKNRKVGTQSYNQLVSNGDYLIFNQSASSLPLPDRSVDVVITDPPFGSNVQYAELSTIWNAWFQLFYGLDNFIYTRDEAVVHRKQKNIGQKSEADYEELLFKVYSETNRVLKDGGYLIFTFNNKNIKVWIAMMKAVARAGFYLPEDGVIFQDFIASYKNTSHLKYAGNIHGDFIYSFVKGKNPSVSNLSRLSLYEEIDCSIRQELTRMFNNHKDYTTTRLYQRIFSRLLRVLLDYIVEHLNDENEMLQVYEYTNNLVDSLLRKYLDYENNIWNLKENVS